MSRRQIYPLDVVFDTKADVPEKIATNKKYKDLSGYTIQEVVDKTVAEVGTVDFLVHSVANGPEVTKSLLEVSRAGYLSANSASAYSLVSLVQRFAPHMSRGTRNQLSGS
jgi:enoyl-[acyl-carrier protein] reductase I